MQKNILILLFSLIMTGCVSPQVINQVDKAYEGSNITMIRNGNFFGSGLRFWITVNGENIAGLYTKQYVKFGLPEGNYKIGIRYLGGNFFPAWEHDQIDINISSNEPQYYLLSPGAWKCDIEKIDEKGALEVIEESSEIPLGVAAPCTRLSEKLLCL